MPKIPAREALEIKIQTAIRTLLSKDDYLLKNGLQERCIAHRLAMHLQPLFRGWDIDCEYNRNADAFKRMQLSRECRELLRRKTDRVIPDIIVHVRGEAGPNLLAIEIKRKGQQGEACDLEKLKGYLSLIEYNYVLYVCFRTSAHPGVEKALLRHREDSSWHRFPHIISGTSTH